ncbi:putative SP-containing protein [Vairimorpha necatrix]|uniref:SP-containing protein n=1 Tax=Vairimorpha necatrix TaxID=6039 RepID=A0AAX4J8Q9_9MICR
MFCSLKIFFYILVVVGSLKNTKVIVDNLEDKCQVICNEENDICKDSELKKLVFELKTNKESAIVFDLDNMEISLLRLQSPSSIKGYDKNDKLILNLLIKDVKKILVILKANPNASFQISSESITICSNVLEDSRQKKYFTRSRGTSYPNKQLLYFSKSDDKTIITKENEKYVLIPSNHDNTHPCWFLNEENLDFNAAICSRKKKVEFPTNKDLWIGISFIESFGDFVRTFNEH